MVLSDSRFGWVALSAPVGSVQVDNNHALWRQKRAFRNDLPLSSGN